MHLAPTFIVAWHIAVGNVRVVSTSDQDEATAVYNTISRAYAKCLYSSASMTIVNSYGGQQWIDKCVKVSNALSATGQRRSTFFAVGWHNERGVKWDCYSKFSSATAKYDSISERYAKVIVGQPTASVVRKYGGEKWVQICLDDLSKSMNSYNEVLCFHTNNGPQTVVYGDSACADAAYEIISPAYAKVLMSSTRGELKRYGGTKWVEICKNTAQDVLNSGSATQMRGVTTYVGWHDENGVNVLGYPDVIAALSAYNSISASFAKVIMDGQDRVEPARYGGSQWVQKCVDYINGLFR